MSQVLLSEEHQMIQETARRFAEAELVPRAAEIDKSGEFPVESHPSTAAPSSTPSRTRL